MFDVALTFLSGLIDMLPAMIGLWILFDFIGTLLFGKR